MSSLACAIYQSATGQTKVDLRTQSRNVDFSGATTTKPSKAGTTLPANCSTGETFFKTDAAAGQNLYGCKPDNTWSLLGGGASSLVAGGGIDIAGSTVAMDDAVVPFYYTGGGAPSLSCSPGRDYYIDTTNQDLYFCPAANTWQIAARPGHIQTTDLADVGNLSLNSSGSLARTYPAGAAGTTAGTLCKFGADGTLTAVTSNESVWAICSSTTAAGQAATAVVKGIATCVAEGTVLQNHYVIPGTTDPSHCKDSGQTQRTSLAVNQHVAGRAVCAGSTCATDGQTFQLLFEPALQGSETSGTGGYSVTAAGIPPDGCATFSGGNASSTGTPCASGSFALSNAGQGVYDPFTGSLSYPEADYRTAAPAEWVSGKSGMYQFSIPFAVKLGNLFTVQNASGTSSDVFVAAVYTDNAGQPGTKIAGTDVVYVGNTATRYIHQAWGSRVTLNPGTYWIRYSYSSTTGQWYQARGAGTYITHLQGLLNGNPARIVACSDTVTYSGSNTVLPGTCTVTAASSLGYPPVLGIEQ